MTKARLEWVISGLKQHALTRAEILFLKTVLADFDKNQTLTARQEKRLEKLYTEKSKLTPNKPKLSLTKGSAKKTRIQMPGGNIP